jgi:FKBP-type peptidyl-prolyl cis-trans isomerase (trigger factor)
MSEAYHSSVEEADIKVAMIVEIKKPECSIEEGLKFTAIIDVEPEFKMPKYEKISLKPNIAKVKDTRLKKCMKASLQVVHHTTR